VRTVSVSKSKYMHVCYNKGKSHAGEVKTKKRKSKK